MYGISNKPSQQPLARSLQIFLQASCRLRNFSFDHDIHRKFNEISDSPLKCKIHYLFSRGIIQAHSVAFCPWMLHLFHHSKILNVLLYYCHLTVGKKLLTVTTCHIFLGFPPFLFYLRTCSNTWKWVCQDEKFPIDHPFVFRIWDSCTLSLWKFLHILFFVFLTSYLSVFSTLPLFWILCSSLTLCPLLPPFSSIHTPLYQQKSFPLGLTEIFSFRMGPWSVVAVCSEIGHLELQKWSLWSEL